MGLQTETPPAKGPEGASKRAHVGRNALAVAAGIVGLSLAAAPFVHAQGIVAPTVPLVIENLGGGAYSVAGGISNTGFVVGKTSVIAIDPQMFVDTAKREMAEIAKITDKPVNTVIVTHSHPDHVNGLPA